MTVQVIRWSVERAETKTPLINETIFCISCVKSPLVRNHEM
jgi:hypothetical protein